MRHVGTPKKLVNAIENGITEYVNNRTQTVVQMNIIQKHVMDYLAQKFTVAFTEAETDNERVMLNKLWNSINLKME